MDLSSEPPGHVLKRKGKVRAPQALLDAIDACATNVHPEKKGLLTTANLYEKHPKSGHAKECLWGQPVKSCQFPGRVSERAEKGDRAQALHDVIDRPGTMEHAIDTGLLTTASVYEKHPKSGHVKECLWGQPVKSCQFPGRVSERGLHNVIDRPGTMEHAINTGLLTTASVYDKHPKSGHVEACMWGQPYKSCHSPGRVSDRAEKVDGEQAMHGDIQENGAKELASLTSVCEKLSKSKDVKVTECLSGQLGKSYEPPEHVSDTEGKIDEAQALLDVIKNRPFRIRVIKRRVIENCVIKYRVIRKPVIKEDLPLVSSLCERLSKSEDLKECLSGITDSSFEPPEQVSDEEGEKQGDQALLDDSTDTMEHVPRDLPSVTSLHKKPSKSGHAECLSGITDSSFEPPEQVSDEEGEEQGDQALLDETTDTMEHVPRDLPSVTSLHKKPSKSGHAEECLSGIMDSSFEPPEQVSDEDGEVQGDQSLLDETTDTMEHVPRDLPSVTSLHKKPSKSGHAEECLSGIMDSSFEPPEQVSDEEGEEQGGQALPDDTTDTMEHVPRDLPSVTSLHKKPSKSGHAEECLSGRMESSDEPPECVLDREGEVQGDEASLGVIKKRVTKECLPSASSLREKLSKSDTVKKCLMGIMDSSYELPEWVSAREGKVQGYQDLLVATTKHVPREVLPSATSLHEKPSRSGQAEECLCGQSDKFEREGKVQGDEVSLGVIRKRVTKEGLPSASSVREKLSKSDSVKEYMWRHFGDSCDATEHASEREGKVDGDPRIGVIRIRDAKKGPHSASSLHETHSEPEGKMPRLLDGEKSFSEILDTMNNAQIQNCGCGKHHRAGTLSGDGQSAMPTLQTDPPDRTREMRTVLCLLLCLGVLLLFYSSVLLCPCQDPC